MNRMIARLNKNEIEQIVKVISQHEKLNKHYCLAQGQQENQSQTAILIYVLREKKLQPKLKI